MILSLYSSVSFKHPFGLAHTIDIAKNLGYQAIDVRGHSLHVPILEERHINAIGYDMLGPNTVDDSGLNELHKRLTSSNLSISGISCYNALTLPEGDVATQSLQYFIEMIDFAQELHIPYVRLIGYSENPFKGYSIDKELAKTLFVARIKTLCEYGKQKGVKILLENGENCIPSSVNELLEIADRVNDSQLELVFDVLNYVFEGLNPYKELKKMGNRVDVLHVKNAKFTKSTDGSYSPKSDRGFKWSYLSDGDIDYKEIFNELLKQGFNGTIVCEYANPYKGMSRDYWNSMPDPYEWAKDARDYILSFPFKKN